MKKILIMLNLSFCCLLIGCHSTPSINITDNKAINKNAEFNAGRAEGLNAPDAFPDCGQKIKSISPKDEEILIINRWTPSENN